MAHYKKNICTFSRKRKTGLHVQVIKSDWLNGLQVTTIIHLTTVVWSNWKILGHMLTKNYNQSEINWKWKHLWKKRAIYYNHNKSAQIVYSHISRPTLLTLGYYLAELLDWLKLVLFQWLLLLNCLRKHTWHFYSTSWIIQCSCAHTPTGTLMHTKKRETCLSVGHAWL